MFNKPPAAPVKIDKAQQFAKKVEEKDFSWVEEVYPTIKSAINQLDWQMINKILQLLYANHFNTILPNTVFNNRTLICHAAMAGQVTTLKIFYEYQEQFPKKGEEITSTMIDNKVTVDCSALFAAGIIGEVFAFKFLCQMGMKLYYPNTHPVIAPSSQTQSEQPSPKILTLNAIPLEELKKMGNQSGKFFYIMLFNMEKCAYKIDAYCEILRVANQFFPEEFRSESILSLLRTKPIAKLILPLLRSPDEIFRSELESQITDEFIDNKILTLLLKERLKFPEKYEFLLDSTKKIIPLLREKIEITLVTLINPFLSESSSGSLESKATKNCNVSKDFYLYQFLPWWTQCKSVPAIPELDLVDPDAAFKAVERAVLLIDQYFTQSKLPIKSKMKSESTLSLSPR